MEESQLPPVTDESIEVKSDRIDVTRPHSARVWDFWLGGKDNYEVDRALGTRVAETFPHIVVAARAGRALMGRTVSFLAKEAGIKQFLDIGTGLPTEPNVHQVAQDIEREARVVYVDNDPTGLAHARALLTSTADGACAYVDSDLREPGKILAEAAKTLDLNRPVAVTLLSIMHFIHDDGDASYLVHRLLEPLPRGSYLVLSHATDELGGDRNRSAMATWNRTVATPLKPRGREQVTELFFAGLEVVEPGIVSPPQWRPDGRHVADPEQVPYWAGVAAKRQ